MSFLSIILAALIVVTAANPSKERCLEDVGRTSNYIDLSKFIGFHNAVMRDFVKFSETANFEGYQRNCRAVQDKATYLRKKLVEESDCLRDHQSELELLVKFDRIMSIIDFWCTLDDEERKGYFKINLKWG